ncbi:MAG: hypothetical protein V4590_14315 [Bacteroidota bacterium]
MEIRNLLLLAGAILVGMIFYYLILPRLNQQKRLNRIIKTILFLGIIGYLSYDFYLKEKYGYLLVLAGGSIAFLVFLFSRKSEE